MTAAREAGQRWAQKRAEPAPVLVTYSEPARYRQALAKCEACGSYCSDFIPAGRHGVRWVAGVLRNCAGHEVTP